MSNEKIKLQLGPELAAKISAGVQRTLSSMFGITPVPQPVSTELECKISADISGIVNLIQEREEGTFIVSFPSPVIFNILGRLYQKEFTRIDRSVEMGVGEITNIIYGTVKSQLNESGMDLKMAIPNIILGHQHVILNLGQRPTMVLPFAIENGLFHILITVYSEAERRT